MNTYEKEELKTTTIHIPSREVFKTTNIDGLIKYKLKERIEEVCGKYGYVSKDSVSLIKRSVGSIITHNGESNISYDLTYKMKIISPCTGDTCDCIIDSITKMGIISFMITSDDAQNNVKDSPVLVIVPQMYVAGEISDYSEKQKISVEVMEKRTKYRAKQIQVVGKIV